MKVHTIEQLLKEFEIVLKTVIYHMFFNHYFLVNQ